MGAADCSREAAAGGGGRGDGWGDGRHGDIQLSVATAATRSR